MDTGLLLWRVTLQWQKKITAALKPLGLTHVQFALMSELERVRSEDGQVNQKQLARRARTDEMMTGQVLRVLETRGLVIRWRAESNRQSILVRLTDLGHERLTTATPVVKAVDDTFFGAAEPDLRDLFTLLGESETA
ncbi:winged helix-turn-helix transcriptional regulator [Herbidospora galbida]|uniref:Winged helix-turn-helix transcriptional regulator n=1 Tax=Herbidospora galbida TaxID=2575442 RepID=A0A4U3M6Q8_9ACTN|nr:MarR family winged helix-turn-helix transcriptional regulator [Herbidospora galbida]TKK84615.1 winged helix-turn-helix transcriptional regulator [Herbidospora galbida]